MMENIDELLKRIEQQYIVGADRMGDKFVTTMDCLIVLRDQQAEIERLKVQPQYTYGYENGIKDCETAIDKEFERTGNTMNILKAVSALSQKKGN